MTKDPDHRGIQDPQGPRAEEIVNAFLCQQYSDKMNTIQHLILFETAVEIKEKTGVKLTFINLSGGVGILYTPDKEPNDIMVIGGCQKGI